MRLIDADKVIQGLRRTIDAHKNGDDYELLTNRIFEKFIEWLMRSPAVEAEPIRHGRWIKMRYRVYQCSCCKRPVFLEGLNVTDENETKLLRELYPYCHCGAKMDGKEKRRNEMERH